MQINYSSQYISNQDIKSVLKVLKSKFLTQGPNVKQFENEIKKIVKAKYSFAVNSATSGLHLACLALNIKKNDVVWTTPNSFVASANCVLHCGAKVDFVDIELNTFNICVNELENKLIRTKKKNLPKAIILVHFAGHPCDLIKINKLSKKYNFKVIEDASHALGAKYKGGFIGDCKYSDMCVFSFHPVKSITTGEGGIITTNSKKTAFKLDLLRNHGINKNKRYFYKKNSEINHYEQIDLGFNFRMNDLEAALGISQLKSLKKFILKRKKIAKIYDTKLTSFQIKKPVLEKNSSWHLYVILLKNKKIRLKLFNYLKLKKINCQIHYIPIHTHPYFKHLGFKDKDFPQSINYYQRCLSLPIYYALNDKNQRKVIHLINKFFEND